MRGAQLLPLLLYRLARDRRRHVRHCLLRQMPALAKDKACVGRVVRILLGMYDACTGLRPLLLGLLLQVFFF